MKIRSKLKKKMINGAKMFRCSKLCAILLYYYKKIFRWVLIPYTRVGALGLMHIQLRDFYRYFLKKYGKSGDSDLKHVN